MQFHSRARNTLLFSLAILTIFWTLLIFPASIAAQNDDVAAMRTQVNALLEKNNYVDALPLLETLAVALPNDADTHFNLGVALIAKAVTVKEQAAKRQLRVRARAHLIKSNQLGRNEQLVKALIESIPPDGSEEARFSENEKAEELMREGEAAFSSGNMDEALKVYQKALEVDPKLYYAALFSGDVYMHKGDYPNAEIWYQRAIAIDPMIETAYRYSATPLMKQRKYDEARDRYIEAYITAPFSRLAIGGIGQWAQTVGKSLGHPKIDIPTTVEKSANGNMTITLGAGDKKDDGSAAWTMYGISRAAWQMDVGGQPSPVFSKAYPQEKAYRHSLAEEFAALKMVIETTKKDRNVKTMEPSLATLVELYDKGLLESYILLARMDQGIVKDYLPYLQNNRAKLRRYVIEYVIGDNK